MADSPYPVQEDKTAGASGRSFGVRELASLYRRRKRFIWATICGLLLICLLYCLVAPNQYDAAATVALRIQPLSSLSMEGAAEAIAPASILSTPLQLETLVNVLRSDRVAWSVIRSEKLYEKPAFSWRFRRKFPQFDAEHPSTEAESYLLEAFGKRLHVRTLPRTLLIEVRFRSKDPGLSAEVANAVVKTYMAQESAARLAATAEASGWLEGQLHELTAQAEARERELSAFESAHDLLSTTQMTASGMPIESAHDPMLLQVDEMGRAMAAASSERILRKALYREAQQGNPEQVLAANPGLQGQMGGNAAAALRTRLSDEGVELAQLKAEHGPNFPRVVELNRAMEDVQRQLKAVDDSLMESFRRSWEAAATRENLLREQLEARRADGLKQNDATIEHAVLRAKAVAAEELCAKVNARIEEAGLAAGVHASAITLVDAAHEPWKPAAPDLPVYLAIAAVVSVWLALGGALLLDGAERWRGVLKTVALLVLMAGLGAHAQAPLPNTQGLPSGVVHPLKDEPATGAVPSRQDAPVVYGQAAAAPSVGADAGVRAAAVPLALPIAAGDFVDVSEFHVPEFHTQARVSAAGTVDLPMVGSVGVLGMSEPAAARAIEAALKNGGMLLHPQVFVLVTAAVGQDVSVLGEVARPGVYAYTMHHRLLDLISAASGLSATAGRLVSVYHRDDPHTAHPVVLDPTGAGSVSGEDHNPELAPGDTVLVSRAGLVYVIGDVVRPGGFAVDPVQGLTVVQALSLAWGSTPSAANKAILIHDQQGGRTLTTLNLKRMIRGQDPDEPVHDRDILFVPNSAAKDLWKKSLESAIQSAVGVTIYAGLVYSQRF